MDRNRGAKSTTIQLLALVLLAGCSQTMTVEDRPGATSAQSNSDHQRCHEMVKAQPGMYVPPQGTLAGAAGAGAIVGVASVIEEERAVDVCMQRLGYTKRALTPQEAQAVRSTPRGAARERAIDSIMMANDPISGSPPPPAE